MDAQSTRDGIGTARPPAVTATVLALLLPAVSVLGRTTGDHLSSVNAALVVSTVAELVALAVLVAAGATATMPTGARA